MATQRQLSEWLGVSQPFISDWINGRKNLSVQTGLRWSELLDVGFKKLMTADTEERRKILGLK